MPARAVPPPCTLTEPSEQLPLSAAGKALGSTEAAGGASSAGADMFARFRRSEEHVARLQEYGKHEVHVISLSLSFVPVH